MIEGVVRCGRGATLFCKCSENCLVNQYYFLYIDDMAYKGVWFYKQANRYVPRITYKREVYNLKTFPDAETAARVRDVAYYFMRGKGPRLNFPDLLLPDNIAPEQILRWMLDSGIPLKCVLPRVAKSILIAAGLNQYDLVMAGVPMHDVANYLPAAGS